MSRPDDLQASRRRFLEWSLAGTAGWAFRPACLLSAEKPLEKLSFIVVTDTHLGYRDKAAAAGQWEKTAVEIARSPADLVLHLGDVVDGGREDQYPIYLKTREQIPQPVHEIPGNHDPKALFEKYLHKPTDRAVDHRWLRFLLLNNARRDSHDGFLSKQQLDWFDEHCRKAKADGKFVALCMHVPAHSNRHPDRGWYVKPEHGQAELYEILKVHQNRVLALFHGHFHNGIRGWDDHVPVQEICFPSALYNRDRKLTEQKAPGYNISEFRPGFTLVTLENQTMTMRYQPVGTDESKTAEKPLVQLSR